MQKKDVLNFIASNFFHNSFSQSCPILLISEHKIVFYLPNCFYLEQGCTTQISGVPDKYFWLHPRAKMICYFTCSILSRKNLKHTHLDSAGQLKASAGLIWPASRMLCMSYSDVSGLNFGQMIFEKQWAAVRTWMLVTRLPPHQKQVEII